MKFFPSFFNKFGYKPVLQWGRDVQWNEPGSGDPGTFYMAWDLAIGQDSSVYVADGRNDRIQKFDANGNFLLSWDTIQGAEEENIFWPDSVTVGYDGNIYVSTVRSEVMKFTPDGKLIWRRGKLSNDKDWLSDPRGIDVSRDGIVYVHDLNNKRIVCFTSDGEYFGKFFPRFPGTRYVVAAPDGCIYISSHSEANVQKYDKSGNYIDVWKRFDPDNNLGGLTVDSEGNVYAVVGDSIKMYSPNGEPIAKLYESEILAGAIGMDISPDKNIFVICYHDRLYTHPYNRIIKLSPIER